MECPFGYRYRFCDYAMECEIQEVALEEAEKLRVALNAEIDELNLRIQQLEAYITDLDLTSPPE